MRNTKKRIQRKCYVNHKNFFDQFPISISVKTECNNVTLWNFYNFSSFVEEFKDDVWEFLAIKNEILCSADFFSPVLLKGENILAWKTLWKRGKQIRTIKKFEEVGKFSREPVKLFVLQYWGWCCSQKTWKDFKSIKTPSHEWNLFKKQNLVSCHLDFHHMQKSVETSVDQLKTF